jgi:hypothetical protein
MRHKHTNTLTHDGGRDTIYAKSKSLKTFVLVSQVSPVSSTPVSLMPFHEIFMGVTWGSVTLEVDSTNTLRGTLRQYSQ